MAIPQDIFLYALWNKDNQSYYVTPDGSVNVSAEPKFIKKPIGWKDIELSFDTVDKYFSNVKSLSVPLQYVQDGAHILRWLLYKGRGYEEVVQCVIFKWNSETGIHELEYKGQITWSPENTLDDIEIGITVNAKEGGLQSDLDAFENTTYELPLDSTNPDAARILFDGVVLFDTYNYSFYDVDILDTISTAPATFLNNEGDSVGIISGSPTYEDLTTVGEDWQATSANYIFSSERAINNVVFSGQATLKFRDGINPDFDPQQISLFLVTSNNQKVFLIPASPANFVQRNGTTFDFSATINLDANEKVFIIFSTPELAAVVKFQESRFKISFTSINDVSYAYSLPPLAIANQLVKKWNTKYSVVSEFLSAHSNIVCTSGQALRNLKDAVLKYSFKEFFDDYNFEHCLCINIIGNVMYIENRPQRFKVTTDTRIFDLGPVPTFKIKPSANRFNKVITGWPDQQYNERNGKYEVNSTVEWGLPVTSKAQELNLVGKGRGDMYGIEFIRGKLNNKDTTDNAGDNQVFMVNVDSSTYYPEVSLSVGKGVQDNVTGVLEFDSVLVEIGGMEDYITLNDPITDFTYHNATAHNARVNFNAYGTKGNEQAVFNLVINGTVVDSVIINDFQTTFRIALSVERVLNTSDVISVTITGEVNIISAGIDMIILGVTPVATYNLKRVAYDDLIGIPTPNTAGAGAAFNIEEMTPARKLRAWGSYLHSILLQLPNDKVTFQTSLKNKELSTTVGLVTITEKDNITVSGLDAPFFINYIAAFPTKIPLTFNKTLSNLLSVGNVRVVYNGFEIFLLPVGKMTSKPATDEAQEWELTLSAYNDLDTLYKLSQESLYISDGMNNTLTISVLNPVQFVYYNKELNVRYKYKDLFDDWVHHRNSQFAVQPSYLQKWELADIIKLQFITNGIGQLELYVYDAWAKELNVITSTIISNPAIRTPYVLQQIDVNPGDYGEGNFLFAIKSNGFVLALSEWQNFAEKQDGTYAIEYSNSYNKLNAYFAEFQPMIRVQAMWATERGEASSTDYEGEQSFQTLDFNTFTTKKIYFGDPYGVPEWMHIKLNNILFLDKMFIEGTQFTRPNDSKFEIIERSGYPLNVYTIDLRRTNSNMDLVVNAEGIRDTVGAIYTLDAGAFGQAPGVIEVEINND